MHRQVSHKAEDLFFNNHSLVVWTMVHDYRLQRKYGPRARAEQMLEYDDALHALWRAAQAFDPSLGFAFSTYARQCIGRDISKALYRCGFFVNACRKKEPLENAFVEWSSPQGSEEQRRNPLPGRHSRRSPSQLFDARDSIRLVRSLLPVLRNRSERQAELMDHIFSGADPNNNAELAKIMGCSRENIRHIKNRAFQFFKRRLHAEAT